MARKPQTTKSPRNARPMAGAGKPGGIEIRPASDFVDDETLAARRKIFKRICIVGAVIVALALGLAISTRHASAHGHDWFFANVPPTGKCPGREIAVSFYDHGQRTANGEHFDPDADTAAHRSMAFGSMVVLTNPLTNQSVTVRINDRGPNGCGRMKCAHREARGLKTLTFDLARGAAKRIGLLHNGWVCPS